MFEIDKQKFGAFVAELRKEKGYTKKELAQRLFISDKAVSKWKFLYIAALLIGAKGVILFSISISVGLG